VNEFFESLRAAATQMEEEVRIIRESVEAGELYTIGLLREKLPEFGAKFPDLEARRKKTLVPKEKVDEFLEGTMNQPAEILPNNSATSLSLPTQSLAAPSLDQLIASRIAVDPETGTVPTEPAPEAVAKTESKTPEDTAEGPPVTVARPADARDMGDAPRDGKPVMLYYQDLSGLQQQPAKWSAAFGRQFWVDEEDGTLGPDDNYIGWRLLTSEEREEYNL
jgi:hypothetical protein